ncbi:MAG: ComF family protein [Gammaproteobacteria bacterium]
MVNNWPNIIQDCLFPPTCLLCDRPGHRLRDLCAACQKHLPRNVAHCPRCAAPMPTGSPSSCLCGQCLKRLPAFDRVHAPYLFQGAIRYLILGLKFRQRFENARLLGALLADSLDTADALPQLLVPVPLHPARYRERGFNQAIEIGRAVARQLRMPLELSVCRRSRNTPHQTGLNAKQRRKNLRHAFAPAKALRVQHVAILDDVVTSGTTVNELAKVLRAAGATRIDVWTCARAALL